MRQEEHKILYALDPEAKPSKERKNAFNIVFWFDYAIIAAIILVVATAYLVMQ